MEWVVVPLSIIGGGVIALGIVWCVAQVFTLFQDVALLKEWDRINDKRHAQLTDSVSELEDDVIELRAILQGPVGGNKNANG